MRAAVAERLAAFNAGLRAVLAASLRGQAVGLSRGAGTA
jgi:hypothetical protein